MFVGMSPRCHAASSGCADLDRVQWAWRVADYACLIDRPEGCEVWHPGLTAESRGLSLVRVVEATYTIPTWTRLKMAVQALEGFPRRPKAVAA